MNTYFTSDTHFGHRKIIEYCDRPFDSVKEMDLAIQDNWNKRVGPNDIVYHLGDFTLGDYKKAQHYFRQVNGQIRILCLPWHHDHRWLREAYYDTEPMVERGELNHYFTKLVSRSGHKVQMLPPMWVLNFKEHSQDGRHPMGVCLSHYAVNRWDRRHYGAIHLFGHSHGEFVPEATVRAMDVGVDPLGMELISLDEMMAKMLAIPFDGFKNHKRGK